MEELLLLLKYAFLGLVQGITEPIPISSSGHLLIVQNLLDVKPPGLSFAVFVNTASLLAVLLIFRNDLIRLVTKGTSYLFTRNEESKDEFMFIIYLIIGTIPAGIIGVLFDDYISDKLAKPVTIGITLMITGVALWAIRNFRGRKGEKNLSMKDAVIVGFAQAVALIPGISRSGATIVASIGLGMKQKTALRFSFLLYIPVSLGGAILQWNELVGDPQLDRLLIPYIVAFLVSFVASYFSLKWLMGIMERGNLGRFTIYCFIVGPLVLFFLT